MPQMILPSKNGLRESGLALEKNIPISGEVPTLVQEAHSKTLAMPLEFGIYPKPENVYNTKAIPTLSQDGQTLTLDDMQLQIFNELWGKLQDILKATKDIVAWHIMLMRWMQSDSVCNSVLTVYHLCII